MIRIQLRTIDRLLNMGIPVQRYRCNTPTCAHELLTRPLTLDAAARPWVVSAALAAIAIILGLYSTSQIWASLTDLRPPVPEFRIQSEEAAVNQH
jgi:hypothetical protein